MHMIVLAADADQGAYFRQASSESQTQPTIFCR
jgi:hypothetical protein